ncbi:acyltransferase [Terasakiispira papahanaumokuakeensis]|uniref:Acyltransferase n=1 Tax=Terasakiispira papahanaumokuakeensis TaxID=197479 RepID=A0A1E2V748_9GAMM|nr:carbon-nitrogen hydrolase family protein [Terasakiispira papahanaumokuakeensis]ODC02838.1 acyltransferase [Terasakiispira papahanaumokuakeensis]
MQWQTAPQAPRIAALQMTSTERVEENLQRAGELIAEAARQGVQLAALPEYFPLLHRDEQEKARIAEDDGDGPIQAFLAEQARQYGIWLVGGSIPLKTSQPDKVYNSLVVYGPDGRRVGRYDKIHLFGFHRGEEHYDEGASIVAGQQPLVIDTPFARIGFGICYDLRFPELFRGMDHIDLLITPAAFTVPTGRDHWELLCRARAVENLCYLLAPAQAGHHPSGRRTYGHSMLVDPWGKVQAIQADGEGVVAAVMDQSRIEEVRTQLPALEHRRLSCR